MRFMGVDSEVRSKRAGAASALVATSVIDVETDRGETIRALDDLE